MNRLFINTSKKEEVVDLSDQVKKICLSTDVHEGLCSVYVPHTTVGLTINSILDPLSVEDLLDTLDQVAPLRRAWKHHGNPPDADGHVKTTLVGSSLTIPISDSELQLGKYQSILLCEFDGPRKRDVFVTILSV